MTSAPSLTLNSPGFPKRGDIYLVRFGPTVGPEVGKTRPALVLQKDFANQFSLTTIVAAISSRTENRLYPSEVLLNKSEGGLKETSVVLLNHIRTIDKRRLIVRVGSVSGETMRRVDQGLMLSLGLNSLS